jgi:sulfatase maturation enzyme AslB (radical SAM superfamily)
MQNKKGLILPTTMHIEVSTYCPKDCLKCYIPEEERRNPQIMTLNIANSAIELGKSLGIRNYNLIGGEPLYKRNLSLINKILETHPSLSFYCCSNGDIFSTKNAHIDTIISKHNLSPGLSIDGFEETNDSIRGKGSFKNVMQASQYLHSKKSLYGAVATLRDINADEVSSPDFVNFIKSQGFNYIFYCQSSSVDSELLEKTAKRILEIKNRNIFVYLNNYGHIDDISKKNNVRTVYVTKDGNILNSRLERISLSAIGNDIKEVVSSSYWRNRFAEKIPY